MLGLALYEGEVRVTRAVILAGGTARGSIEVVVLVEWMPPSDLK